MNLPIFIYYHHILGLENGQKLMMWDSPYAINTTTRGYHLGMVLTRTDKNGDDFGMVPFCTMPGQAAKNGSLRKQLLHLDCSNVNTCLVSHENMETKWP